MRLEGLGQLESVRVKSTFFQVSNILNVLIPVYERDKEKDEMRQKLIYEGNDSPLNFTGA
jgi:hypothetical protein